MKTTILHLDPHDDLISIRDKMAWAKTPRILLVTPRKSRTNLRPVDLTLLERQARQQGAQLGLVTRQTDLREAARQEGVSVFASIPESQRGTWSAPPLTVTRRAPRHALYAWRSAARPPAPAWLENALVRLAIFSAGVLAVLAVIALFIPSATIRLQPQSVQQVITLDVSAAPQNRVIGLGGTIPARTLILTLEGTRAIKIAAQTELPDTAATGSALFTNLTDAPVNIPAGAVISSLGELPVRFEVTAPGTLEAGTRATLVLPVRALQAGSVGNLPAGALRAIVGNLGLSASVTNPEATSGGTDKVVAYPGEGARLRLYALLESALRADALEQAQTLLAEGDLLLPHTLRLERTLSEAYIPAPGEPGETLTLSVRLEYRVEYAAESDLRELARLALDANLAGAAYQPVAASLQLEMLEPPQGESAGGATRWKMVARREVRAVLNAFEAVQRVLGASPAEAESRLLQSFSLEKPPSIEISPAWWGRLPLIPLRIQVETEG
jgi:hypothetical protein